MVPITSYQCQTPGSTLDFSLKPHPAQQQFCLIYFLNRSTIHPPAASCGLHSGPIQHHLPPEPSQPLPGLLALASALSLSPLSHRQPKGTCHDTWVRSHKSQSSKSSPAYMGLLSHTGFLAAPPINTSDMLQPQGLVLAVPSTWNTPPGIRTAHSPHSSLYSNVSSVRWPLTFAIHTPLPSPPS